MEEIEKSKCETVFLKYFCDMEKNKSMNEKTTFIKHIGNHLFEFFGQRTIKQDSEPLSRSAHAGGYNGKGYRI